MSLPNHSQPSTSGTYSRPSLPRTQQMSQSNISDEQLQKLTLKTDYMSLLDDTNAIAGSGSAQQTISEIHNVVDRAEELFIRVSDPSEMYLDAKIFHSATATLEQTTNNIDVGEGNFKLFMFAEEFKVKALNEEGKPSWETLAAVAKPVVHNSLPYWTPLLGSFEFSVEVAPSQQRRARQPRQKDLETEKKEPEKLIDVEKTQKGVEEIVQAIFTKLKRAFRKNKQQPIRYFRFVVDPASFSATVENIFHLSFLVNDGHVKIELDDDGEPFITPITQGKENSNPQQSQASEKKQNIISIDMKTWKALVEVMEIDSSMI